jgi:hypothetical protein
MRIPAGRLEQRFSLCRGWFAIENSVFADKNRVNGRWRNRHAVCTPCRVIRHTESKSNQQHIGLTRCALLKFICKCARAKNSTSTSLFRRLLKRTIIAGKLTLFHKYKTRCTCSYVGFFYNDIWIFPCTKLCAPIKNDEKQDRQVW